MTRHNGNQRAGISLIELLVVIAIIGVLISILIPAVQKVRESGTRADTTSRISGISNAIGTFKAQRNVNYIPGGQVDINPASATYGQVVGPFRLRNSYADPYSFEAQYIKQVFGTHANLADLGNPGLSANLDANQTLLFFLNGIQESDGQGGFAFRGFSNNRQRPFTPASSGEERAKPYLDISSKHTAAAPNGFAWLVDGWGRPFAYFSAFNGKPAKAGQMAGWNVFPGLGNPIAYQNGNRYENESGFQIISAGTDGLFGGGGDWLSVDFNGKDDRANFSTTNLGAGPK